IGLELRERRMVPDVVEVAVLLELGNPRCGEVAVVPGQDEQGQGTRHESVALLLQGPRTERVQARGVMAAVGALRGGLPGPGCEPGGPPGRSRRGAGTGPGSAGSRPGRPPAGAVSAVRPRPC